MVFKCVSERTTNTEPDLLMNAVNVWNTRPHIINRKLAGAKILGKYHYLTPPDFEVTISNLRNLTLANVANESELKRSFAENHDLPLVECLSDRCEQCEKIRLDLKCLILRNQSKNPKTYEIVVTDNTVSRVLFCELSSSSLGVCSAYYISFENDAVRLFIDSECSSEGNQKWLMDVLLPKVIKWADNQEFFRTNANLNASLRLVSIDTYSELYNVLKEKYGRGIVKIWPEVTDPLKFVYEDVAIATYLLILWSAQGKFQKFIDLGCGNGLLVHILNSEGHDGQGIDIRSRKIWNLYPKTTKLKAEAITPSDNTLYPEADWLIGNHSDELTPWIPVMAARSSHKCKFFLLPCCAYEFNGKKYQRKNSAKSLYSDYMDYIKFVCDSCGFVTESDKLRIPSTKRCCFVSQGRSYPDTEHVNKCIQIQSFVDRECGKTRVQSDEELSSPKKSKWSAEFVPRDKEERVKNCTKVDKAVVSNIIAVIVEELLSRQFSRVDKELNLWEPDYGVEISMLAKLIPREDLVKLKSECGGLQTLLRNNQDIFQMENGKVFFRKPQVRKKNENWKRKPCWFFYNHPASCALADEDCSFAH
ncbi:unnamed protein product [Bemisia tabaci]|uniref:tRNA (uracil-O(2)-)-methyltransferase n=1 Tax=Bemisia tabaci TaxID=7038 RepID=A0A9P0ABU4_BEMTA|nr:unnamed protein product [Bemisia tabaci]